MKNVTLEVGNDSYHLKLSTQAALDLEKKLGKGIIAAVTSMSSPETISLNTVLWILHFCLQAQHGVNFEKTCKIYDAFIAEDHSMVDLIPIFIDCFKESGIIPKKTDDESSEGEDPNA